MSARYTDEDHSYRLRHTLLLLVFSLFATVAVVFRFWARKIKNQALALNDYLIILGMIFALGETAVNIYGCCFPTQWKKDNSASIDMKIGLQLSFISPILWVVGVTMIRASVISLYLQLFPVRPFRMACYAALALNMAFLISMVIADCLICQPIAYRWDYTIKDGHCGNQKPFDLFVAVVNLLLDALAVVFPMPILWGLQMATGRKIALSGIFGMGIAICAVTIYRVQVTATIGKPDDPNTKDAYSLIPLLTSLEALLGVISACMPILKPVFDRLWDLRPGRGRLTSDPFTSGSVPLKMRISHLLRRSSQKRHARQSVSSAEPPWYDMPGEKHKDQAPPTPKADRVLGMQAPVITVRSDVDAESMVSDL